MTFKLNNVHKAVNWNVEDDDFTQAFWDQNVKQFWLPEEISVSKDVKVWSELSPEERNLYKKVLGGLTLLDTKQANNGIPSMMSLTDNLQRKAVLSFMGTMEEIHAKSYSSIFTTLLTVPEIDEIFEWIESEPTLQKKAEIVLAQYENTDDRYGLYMSMATSVFLESFLFYSGFFYPLFLAGQGKMMASGEIISLILRDESLHGKYIGLLAQEIFKDFSKEEQKERFLKRLNNKEKNWKFSASDVEERQHWDDYMDAYAKMLTKTSTDYAPWFVIPADHKWFMRYAVGEIISQHLDKLKMYYPQLTKEETENLKVYRKLLEEEDKAEKKD